MISDAELRSLGERVAVTLHARELRMVSAESCTGGWIGKVLTDISGSSSWYLGGVIAYSNALKEALLHVTPDTLVDHGAVSEQVARAMARGALQNLGGEVSVAVTGIAGPDGGTPEKPVGTVWFAWAVRSGESIVVHARREVFIADREGVRRSTVDAALKEVLQLVA